MSLSNGLYESVINKLIDEEILKAHEKKDKYIDRKSMDKEEGNSVLSKYMSIVISKSLQNVSGDNKLNRQVEVCNKIVNLLMEELKLNDLDDFLIYENAELLLAVLNNRDVGMIDDYKDKKVRPITSIANNSLFTGAQNEPSLGSELVKEINTADRIDMLVSFIKWSGLVQIYGALKEFTKDHKLRIITTSYMGATDYKAILELSRLPNTEIRISYDTQRTRLHSKSYMFYRNTGFSTAYIGSSNLSNSALTTGLEWNLKILEYTSKDMIKKFNATFESNWHNNEFYLFNKDDANDKEKPKTAYKRTNLKREVTYAYTKIKSIDSKRALSISKTLIDELQKLIQCPRDYFSIEVSISSFIKDGEFVEGPPEVDVFWFDRGQEVQDKLAKIITIYINSIGYESVDVIFYILEESRYYEYGEHF